MAKIIMIKRCYDCPHYSVSRIREYWCRVEMRYFDTAPNEPPVWCPLEDAPEVKHGE